MLQLVLLIIHLLATDCLSLFHGTEDEHVILCNQLKCVNGQCFNSVLGPMCFCDKGWAGHVCDKCHGISEVSLEELFKSSYQEGYITDGYGNYTLENKCSWYIPYQQGGLVRLRLEHFATECGWDYLYVFDGMSIYAPLLGVFSGLLVKNKKSRDVLPEMVSQSGAVFLHFFSDLAYNMTGFNISISAGQCPYKCSGRGLCDHTHETCTCHTGWTGDGCQYSICPNSCSQHGHCTKDGCQCEPSYRGEDCSKDVGEATWAPVHSISPPPIGQASHQAVVIGEYMWVVSGYTFKRAEYMTISRYKFSDHSWLHLPTDSSYPKARYGHSTVVYKDKIYMFGGLVNKQTSSDLWEYSPTSNNDKWSYKEVKVQTGQTVVGVVGHTAHVIGDAMVVIFGYNTQNGYISFVQECNLDTFEWRIPAMTGAIVQGSYGHTSTYDPSSGLILVHGGYQPTSTRNSTDSAVRLSDSLYAYNPRSRTWQVLRSSGLPRLLHSAVIIDRLMLVFGGNVHTDRQYSTGAKCHSASFMAFDVGCESWHELELPNVQAHLERFGHTAVVYNGSMYVFGGFSGVMLNDIFMYNPGDCKQYRDKERCRKTIEGVRCAWSNTQGCVKSELTDREKGLVQDSLCLPGSPTGQEQSCNNLETCSSCVAASFACHWCADKCIKAIEPCYRSGISPKGIRTADECIKVLPHLSSNCSLYHNCRSCLQQTHCDWVKRPGQNAHRCYYQASSSENNSSSCAAYCDERHTCEECAGAGVCMWCSNLKQCVPSNAYITNFPYGQCMDWTSHPHKCPVKQCSDHRQCQKCSTDPGCGWCEDVSFTGLGTCMEGGGRGPAPGAAKNNSIATRRCHATLWHFASCPLCQCNGHSTCILRSLCRKCLHYTTGSHCEICKKGYFGSPVAGGTCSACKCNRRADNCNHKTGDCFCRTKGVVGKHCDRCDESRQYRYYGRQKVVGSCYYDLKSNYQFTFNLTKDVDKHLSQINFLYAPLEPAKEVKFSINCSRAALFNLTLVSKREVRELTASHVCKPLSIRFSPIEFDFRPSQNTTFLVHVYSFTPPFWIQVSFSQDPHLDLFKFLIVFISCFFALLVLAAGSWKIKQCIDYRRLRQHEKREMANRVSRPFSTVFVDFERLSTAVSAWDKVPPDIRAAQLGKQKSNVNKPAPVALEPLFGNKAAILTLIVLLPKGEDDFTPPGVSGIMCGSSTVSLGHAKKNSGEYGSLKSANKRKSRKPIPADLQENRV